jgi:hypothetical protein
MRGRTLLVVGLAVAVLACSIIFSSCRPGGREARESVETMAGRDTTREAALMVRLYFASPGGDSLAGETRELASRPGLHERVEGLVRELVRGSRNGGVALLAPGTAVRHVYLDHRGLMTLDLTPAFRDRFRGGSTAEYLAVGSLARTLFANLPEVRRVRLTCAGGPLATLRGHIACDQPFDRSDLP